MLVILPTGEGKSLIYQALWKSQKRKTIAVVVPTITLAQDQESEIHRNPKTNTDRLHAYIGGEDKRNSTIKAAIPSGEQGLFFSSPKAIGCKNNAPIGRAISLMFPRSEKLQTRN